MPEGAILIKLWHIVVAILGVISTLVLIYKNGIAPRIQRGKEEAEEEATFRTQTDERLKSMEEKVDTHVDSENSDLEEVKQGLATIIKEGREDRRGFYNELGGVRAEVSALRGEFKHLEGRMDEHMRHAG